MTSAVGARRSDRPRHSFKGGFGPLLGALSGRTLHIRVGLTRRGRVVRFSLPIAAAFLLLSFPASALADLAVHVTPTSSPAPDSCAICHRAHTSNTPLGYRGIAGTEAVGLALTLSTTPGRGDIGLCYACHGVAALGASINVETSFTLTSVHRIAPSQSPTFGPNPKMCGSCHDPHGTARRVDGTPYPALLRAWTSANTTVTAGEEYCDACHQGRSSVSRYDALATYRSTGHYKRLPDPASGTRIRCSNCHVAHGSRTAPLIVGSVVPAGASAPDTVTANDRTMCVLCHYVPFGTWADGVAYSGSSHSLSATRVPIPGEWPTPLSTRKLGECQVCHAPMGRSDGDGVIPKLAEKRGRQQCDTCHKSAGASSKDLASLAYPTGESTRLELAAVYGPVTQTASARVAVYGRDPASFDSLLGPKEYRAPGAGTIAASGDVDGDGEAELVVADPAASKLTVYERDALLGISAASLWSIDVPITPDFIAIGRFLDTPSRAQIAIVDATAATPRVRVYSYDGSGLVQRWADTFPDGASARPSGIASGDMTGTARADLVITDAGVDKLHILTEVTAGSLSWTSAATQPGPRGPSVGDAWPGGGNEIVVCNALASTATVSVFDGAGTKLGDFTANGGTGSAVPYASTVANVLWGDAAAEVCIALHSDTGTSRINVFKQTGSELSTTPLGWDTGMFYGSGSLAAGDLNGDTRAELAVGNGGRWAPLSGMQAPSVQTFRWINGETALPPAIGTYIAGGTELAGAAPALAIADFGGVVPSRHPIDEVNAASHVSTETASVVRHVTCTDCHNPHEANGAVDTAPYSVEGRLAGAWGVETTLSAPGRVLKQYGVCYKCHSGYATLGARRDIASEVCTLNPSVHAVEASQTNSAALSNTFVAPWGNGSILYCTDCHGDSASPPDAVGPHRSGAAPLLVSPVLGVGPGDPSGLCYRCHMYELYRQGTVGGAPENGTNGSFFYAGVSLHKRHSGAFSGANTGLELSCLACHVSHGSPYKEHLIRNDAGVRYTHVGPNGGSCDNDCHGGVHTYP
jgi:nitrate/TMAO reductase-like tetraheme cytochrome c subunit